MYRRACVNVLCIVNTFHIYVVMRMRKRHIVMDLNFENSENLCAKHSAIFEISDRLIYCLLARIFCTCISVRVLYHCLFYRCPLLSTPRSFWFLPGFVTFFDRVSVNFSYLHVDFFVFMFSFLICQCAEKRQRNRRRKERRENQ